MLKLRHQIRRSLVSNQLRPLIRRRTLAIQRSQSQSHSTSKSTSSYEPTPKITALLTQLPHSTRDTHLLSKLISTFSALSDAKQRASLAEQIIAKLPFSTKPATTDLLSLSLLHLQPSQLSKEQEEKLLDYVVKLSLCDTKYVRSHLIHQLTSALSALNSHDSTFLQRFTELAESQKPLQLTSSLLIQMQIQRGRLAQAYQTAICAIEEKGIRARAPVLELLTLHLTRHGKLQEACHILEIAERDNYAIYPRTLTPLLQSLISFNEVSLCVKHHELFINRCFLPQQTLLQLAQLLHSQQSVFIRHIKQIYAVALLCGDMTMEQNRAYHVIFTEMKTQQRGFLRGFKFLSDKYNDHFGNVTLRVADFPNLQEKVCVSGREEGLKVSLLKRMRYSEPSEVKSFYLNLVINQLLNTKQSRLLTGLFYDIAESENDSNMKVISHFINVETLSLAIKADQGDDSSLFLSSFVQLLIKNNIAIRSLSSPLKLRLFERVVADQHSWVYSFKLMSLLDYKFQSFKGKGKESERLREAQTKEELRLKCLERGYLERAQELQQL